MTKRWACTKYWLRRGKSEWLVKGNPKGMPCKSDSNHRKGATQPPVCLSTQPVLFFLRTNVYLFLYFPSLWEFFFTQSRRARVLSLTTGLVAIEFGVLTAATQPQSLAGNQSRASSPYRLRSASLSAGHTNLSSKRMLCVLSRFSHVWQKESAYKCRRHGFRGYLLQENHITRSN